MPNGFVPPVEPVQAVTLQNRGVAVPFTTPLLAGARVRKALRAASELVVPNPSGSRGVRIVQWAGLRADYHPTVHDMVLSDRIACLDRIDPASVRAAGQDVAIEGYAGQAAAMTATNASQRDRSHSTLVHYQLVVDLLEQQQPGGLMPVAKPDRAEFASRGAAVLDRIARSLSTSVGDLEADLAALGQVFGPVGIGRNDRSSRIPALIARVTETQGSLALWLANGLENGSENDIGALGQTMAFVLTTIAEAAEVVLAGTRTMLLDPLLLLKRWRTQPDNVLTMASRCEWLLDGWERVCLLWLVAESITARRAALLEMAQSLPILPAEVNDWCDVPIPHETMHQACRVISHNDTWRSGSAAVALIHRNETLRAMSL